MLVGRHFRVCVVAFCFLLLAGCGGSKSATKLPTFGPGSGYHPKFHPADFSADVTNPWFPLKPGTTYFYTGVKDGKPSRDVYAVSHKIKMIDGVPCRVVNDSLFLNGKLGEKTIDYYTQDQAGNVWYFGEETEELDANGKVLNRDGTWHAGVDGAQPGVYITADPKPGAKFRQEYYKGQAEDQFKVLSLNSSLTVPYGSYRHVLRTQENTALEPDVLDNKYYARGIGEIEEIAVRGPLEKAVLVRITHSTS